tara:strand:+ start:556 stop:729 length:174 start_codon:yes stop_codon:yes gene_type:complete
MEIERETGADLLALTFNDTRSESPLATGEEEKPTAAEPEQQAAPSGFSDSDLTDDFR